MLGGRVAAVETNALLGHQIVGQDTTSLVHQYFVHLPAGYQEAPDRQWPTVLYLHGGGRVTRERLASIIDPLADLPAIVIAPLCTPSPRGGLYTNWDFWILGDIVREVSETYRVDPAQRSVIGFSMGGSGAWELPFYQPDLFSKVVVIAGVCHVWSLRHFPEIPVWVFSGADDFVYKEQRETITSALRFGVDVVATIWPGQDHGGINRSAMSTQRMLQWLVSDEDLRSETVAGMPAAP